MELFPQKVITNLAEAFWEWFQKKFTRKIYAKTIRKTVQ